MRQPAAIILLGCSGLLIIASFAWPALFDASNAISPEEYDRLEELEARIETLHLQGQSYQRRTNSDAPSEEYQYKMDEAVAERNALRERLESGVERPQTLASWFWYCGLISAAIGITVQIASKPN